MGPLNLGRVIGNSAEPQPSGSNVNPSGSEVGFTRARGQDDVSKHKANSLKLIVITVDGINFATLCIDYKKIIGRVPSTCGWP